jgi:hypothetical protein
MCNVSDSVYLEGSTVRQRTVCRDCGHTYPYLVKTRLALSGMGWAGYYAGPQTRIQGAS